MMQKFFRLAAPALLAGGLLTACGQEPKAPPARVEAKPAYVGTAACADCHEAQRQAWQGSHHDLALQAATGATVLGDFGNRSFSKDGVTSTFSRKDGQFQVRTDGPDGQLADFTIGHTFGVAPLQQYLVPFPDGRWQALPIAWDSRPAAEGGQRWFHLYPDEKIDASDPLHWTAPAQNWNHMCADCHSTNLRKNYDPATGRFGTTWTDIDVGCEACHGPGSRHVDWARTNPRQPDPARGLTVTLPAQPVGRWQFASGDPIANRSAPPPPFRAEVETCGRCHSRRGQVWAEFEPGQPLADAYRVALLEPGLYHADGQIQGEVFEYGSFLQSRMYAAGVTCSDCHEPHTARLRAQGDALCAQCHQPAVFEAREHTLHPAGAPGSQCVNCHMGEQLYMVVDGRRDHSFRVPRPDLSRTTGAPNACNDCHRDRSADWAADLIARHFGTTRRQTPHYAEALAAGRTGDAEAPAKLRTVLADAAVPAIARATALGLLAPDLAADDPALRKALQDPDPLVRRTAAEALESLAPGPRLDLGAPLLKDPVRTVRLAAFSSLMDVPPAQVLMEERPALQAAAAEYRTAQQQNADRAEGQLNLGLLESSLGNAAAAEQAYRAALAREPGFVPAYVNLADLLARTGREGEADRLLRQALKLEPGNAGTHHALGLSLVRQQKLPEALPELARARALQPTNARFAYVYAVALHETGRTGQALEVLETAQARHPNDGDIAAALEAYRATAAP